MNFSPLFTDKVRVSAFVEKLKQGQIIIDNSEYSTWSSCFPMGLYTGALKRVSARARSALAFGSAVHSGLEQFFKQSPDWQKSLLADAAISGLDKMGDPKRTSERAVSLVESYILEYNRRNDLKFNILYMNDGPAVEQSFMIPLGTILVEFQGAELSAEVLWTGKIDLLTRYEDAIAVVDHKTTSVMGPQFADDKQRSNQTLGYTYAVKYLSKQLFNDCKVFGCRINALASRQSGYEFKVFDFPYPDWKIAEWQSETLIQIEHLVQQLDRFLTTNEAAPTREHCVTKYGRCPYYDLCDAHSSMRDRMIFDDSYFYETKWSPLNE